jgi:peptidylprolyl isomerase
LSRAATTTIFVPILEVDAVLGREQLDHLARPLLERTVAATLLALRSAGIGVEEIAAVFLVGGSSRMSLPVTMLHEALGVAPTVIEQPELIVAGGTLHLNGAGPLGAEVLAKNEVPVAVPREAPRSNAGQHVAAAVMLPGSRAEPAQHPYAGQGWPGPSTGTPPRRSRTGLLVAAALVALFVVAGVAAGAVAGIRYLGDRVAEQTVAGQPNAQQSASGQPVAELPCMPRADNTFPPLLGGFDKRLATAPTVTAGTGDLNGLGNTIVIDGTCAPVKPGQTITANYVGATLRDGKVFDSSWSRMQTIDVTVGLHQLGRQIEVIEGWDTGLIGVRVGSRVQLDIPPRMAYGEAPPAGAPSGPLRFVVEVLDAKDA